MTRTHFFRSKPRIAALVLYSALVAAARARVAEQRPLGRVSLVKLLELLRPLWLTLALGEVLFTARQKNQLVQRFSEHMGRRVTAPRRSHSSARAVRQPVSGWPRLLPNESVEGPLHFQLL